MNRTPSEIAELADGLWRRMRDVVLAERRLESFAFAPERPEAGACRPDRVAALLDDEAALAALARDVTLRALAAATDVVNYRILAGLGDEPAGLDQVARAAGLPPLAVSERVTVLARLGLASRALEQDGVTGTAAGRAMIALVDAISADLAARCRADAESLS